MGRCVTAFVFPGLNGAGHPDDYAWMLRLPGFQAHWALVVAAFATTPGFARFDAALQAGDELPRAAPAWSFRALAVAAMQLAAATALERRGEHADWLCGYSLGDLARSCHARAATFAQLVAFAAGLPALPCVDGASAAAITRDHAATTALRRTLQAVGVAACRLSPRFVLFAGEPAAMAAARSAAAAAGAHVRDLGDCPLHAPVLRDTAGMLHVASRGVAMRGACRRMFSTLWGRAVTGSDDLRREFTANVAQPIDFARAVSRLRRRHGVTRFVDLGPGRHASRFVRHHGTGVHAVHCSELLALTAP